MILYYIRVSSKRELIGGIMKIKYFQKGFNYSQDGPGNRLVYHLHGCNLKCPWCANPEGMKIGIEYKGYPVTEAEISEIMAEILSCEPLFFDGGGVTFTGGEVSLQLPQIETLLKLLKAENINTCIETNGTNIKLPVLYPFLDRLIIDFKSGDETKLSEVTNADMEAVLKNIGVAVENGISTLIRIPLIKGFNESDEDIGLFIHHLSKFSQKAEVELLCYHEYGKEKWQKCGLEYTVRDAFISPQRQKEIKEKFLNAGFKIITT